MPIDKDLLEILACPACKEPVTETEGDDGHWLECARCRLRYPVRDGIPVMLTDEASPLPEPHA